MKRQIVHSRSSIFLMEIIIAILFFSLVSAVCLQVFVKAHNMTEETARLNMAVTVVGNTAEMTKAAESPDKVVDIVKEVYPSAGSIATDADKEDKSNKEADGLGLPVGFDEDWKSCDTGSTDCRYILQATYDDTVSPVSWHIEIRTDADDVIYELNTEVYYGQ